MFSLANIVYQAALKDATSILEGEEIESTPPVHPYQIALGMICLQQVCNNYCKLKPF